MSEPSEHEEQQRQDPREGAEPDRQGTTDVEAGVMEGDLPVEPPRGGAGEADPAGPEAPAREAGERDEAPVAEGDQPAPRQAGPDSGA